MPSRQALELLQVRQMRSPGQLLRNSSRHLRHLRSLASYLRSGSGFEFFSELLIARIYSSSFSKMRYFCCTAKGLFFRPVHLGRSTPPPPRANSAQGRHPGSRLQCGWRDRPRLQAPPGYAGEETACERSAVSVFRPRCQFEIKKKLAALSTIAKTRKIEAELNAQELSDRELNR